MSRAIPREGGPSWPKAVLLALVLVAAASLFSTPVADNDLWGHVYFGRAILAEGRIPSVNRYSYTAPNFPWINHEILAECAFAWTFDHAGAPGLLLLKTVIGLATLALIARITIRRVSLPLVWGAALLWASSMMAWGFLVRPQIFSSLALAVVWDRLEAHDTTRRVSSLFLLPLLFAIWINTHGAVVAGVGMLLLYVALDRLRTPFVEWRATALIAGICVVALLANPYGIGLLRFLWTDLTHSRAISEWEPISLMDSSFFSFKLAVLVVLVGPFVNPTRRPWELVILGIAAIMTFRHQRHLPLFAIIAAPYLGETLGQLASRRNWLRADRIGHPLLLVGLAAVAALDIARMTKIHYELGGQIFVEPGQFPIRAVGFLKENQLAGNLLLPFDWGEYAIWHLYPRYRVSVDGRYTTAYPREVLQASQRFLAGAPGWEKSLRDATIVLVDRRQPNALSLFKKEGWAYVYSDATALVFVRRDALGGKPLVRRMEPSLDPIFP